MTRPTRASGRPTQPSDATRRPRKVAISRIEMDSAIQPRLRMSKDAVARYSHVYRNNPRGMPPVLLATIGKSDKLHVIDGFHRVLAAQRAHRRDIPAIIIETSRVEARWIAVEANFKNGVPISRAEKRIVFRRFVDAGRNRKAEGSLMSSRELAMALPLGSHQSMLSWMKADFPKVHAEMVGGEPEEEEAVEDEGSRKEDQMLANIEWAESEFLAAIRKAQEVVPKERIAEVVHDIRERVRAALDVPDIDALLPEVDATPDF